MSTPLVLLMGHSLVFCISQRNHILLRSEIKFCMCLQTYKLHRTSTQFSIEINAAFSVSKTYPKKWKKNSHKNCYFHIVTTLQNCDTLQLPITECYSNNSLTIQFQLLCQFYTNTSAGPDIEPTIQSVSQHIPYFWPIFQFFQHLSKSFYINKLSSKVVALLPDATIYRQMSCFPLIAN